MNEEDILNDFNGKKAELSKLIKSWNLINVFDKSGFDILSEKILRSLYEGQTELRIKRIIESEFSITYGLFTTDFDAEELTEEILWWWSGKS